MLGRSLTIIINDFLRRRQILLRQIGSVNSFSVDYTAIIMTVSLGAVYFVSKKIIRNGISPIILICIAGIAGIFVFGW